MITVSEAYVYRRRARLLVGRALKTVSVFVLQRHLTRASKTAPIHIGAALQGEKTAVGVFGAYSTRPLGSLLQIPSRKLWYAHRPDTRHMVGRVLQPDAHGQAFGKVRRALKLGAVCGILAVTCYCTCLGPCAAQEIRRCPA